MFAMNYLRVSCMVVAIALLSGCASTNKGWSTQSVGEGLLVGGTAVNSGPLALAGLIMENVKTNPDDKLVPGTDEYAKRKISVDGYIVQKEMNRNSRQLLLQSADKNFQKQKAILLPLCVEVKRKISQRELFEVSKQDIREYSVSEVFIPKDDAKTVKILLEKSPFPENDDECSMHMVFGAGKI